MSLNFIKNMISFHREYSPMHENLIQVFHFDLSLIFHAWFCSSFEVNFTNSFSSDDEAYKIRLQIIVDRAKNNFSEGWIHPSAGDAIIQEV